MVATKAARLAVRLVVPLDATKVGDLAALSALHWAVQSAERTAGAMVDRTVVAKAAATAAMTASTRADCSADCLAGVTADS